MRAVLLALLAVSPWAALAAAHEGQSEPGLGEAQGGSALGGLHAPGDLVVAPWGELTVDGHLGEFGPPAAPGQDVAVAFLQNATDLGIALDAPGHGWFVVGVDLQEASRALLALQERVVARHLAVGGWLDDGGNLTVCTGALGVTYGAATPPAHGREPAGEREGALLVWDRTSDGACAPAPWLHRDAAASLGRTHIELGLAKARLGAVPGDVRHVLVATQATDRLVPPSLTGSSTWGDLNVLLARPGDDPAALVALVRGASDAAAVLGLVAVPLGAAAVAVALRRRA